jgi:hypothetical protein
VGTLLLLDTRCEDFTALVKPSQISHSARKRKRATVTYDTAGIPIPSLAQEAEEIINTDRFIQVIYLLMSMLARCFFVDNILILGAGPTRRSAKLYASPWQDIRVNAREARDQPLHRRHPEHLRESRRLGDSGWQSGRESPSVLLRLS